MREPVNRTILLLDIERFGHRNDVEQAFLRRTLHDVVEDTLAAAAVERTQQHREDRGDGQIVLMGGDVSKTSLLRALLTAMPDALASYNHLAAQSTQMRLRTVLASGEVTLDARDGTLGGIVGHDLNQAFRLLDAPELREALRLRPHTSSALCVSEAVYNGVVRHGHRGVRPEEFHHVTVRAKEGQLNCWLHGPATAPAANEASGATSPGRDGGSGESGESGGPGTVAASGSAAAVPAAPQPSPGTGPVISFGGGRPDIGGSVVAGDQHGVSGGTVHGDVHLGGDRREGGDGDGERGGAE